MKKVFAILLALTLCLSLGVTAFAADTTITAPDNERSYEVYQIFTGDLEEGKLTNVLWGQNGTGTAGDAVDEDVLEAIEALTKAEDIAAYADLTGEPIDTITDSEEITVPTGYYLIKDIGEVGEGEAYSLYIIQVVGPTTISPKDSVPEVKKEIVEGSEKVNVNEASVGDKVEYKITGTVPSRIGDYNTYFYRFNDTLSEGLTYNGDMAVTVNGVDVTEYFYINAEENTDNKTEITVSIKDLKALALLEDPEVGAITANTKVVLSYTATLNEDAVIDGPNPNTVDLDYSNNPNDSGDPSTEPPEDNPPPPDSEHPIGTTPDSVVETYVTKLTVLKVDEEGEPLTGAAFKLEGDGVVLTKVTGSKFEKAPYTAQTGETVQTGTYYKLANGKYTTTAPTTATASEYASTTDTYVCVDFEKWVEKAESESAEAYVNEDGELVFTGLGAGEYTLTETVTPAGYNSVDPSTVTIVFDEDSKTFYIEELAKDEDEDGEIDADSMTMEITIVNKSGAELPETGGIGTTLFYIFGGIMVVAAIVVFTTRKRMGAED